MILGELNPIAEGVDEDLAPADLQTDDEAAEPPGMAARPVDPDASDDEDGGIVEYLFDPTISSQITTA